MEKKIRIIMAKVFEIEISKISPKTTPSNIDNWDSLRHLMLIVELEKEFKVNFTDDELVRLADYKSICQIVTKKNKK